MLSLVLCALLFAWADRSSSQTQAPRHPRPSSNVGSRSSNRRPSNGGRRMRPSERQCAAGHTKALRRVFRRSMAGDPWRHGGAVAKDQAGDWKESRRPPACPALRPSVYAFSGGGSSASNSVSHNSGGGGGTGMSNALCFRRGRRFCDGRRFRRRWWWRRRWVLRRRAPRAVPGLAGAGAIVVPSPAVRGSLLPVAAARPAAAAMVSPSAAPARRRRRSAR